MLRRIRVLTLLTLLPAVCASIPAVASAQTRPGYAAGLSAQEGRELRTAIRKISRERDYLDREVDILAAEKDVLEETLWAVAIALNSAEPGLSQADFLTRLRSKAEQAAAQRTELLRLRETLASMIDGELKNRYLELADRARAAFDAGDLEGATTIIAELVELREREMISSREAWTSAVIWQSGMESLRSNHDEAISIIREARKLVVDDPANIQLAICEAWRLHDKAISLNDFSAITEAISFVRNEIVPLTASDENIGNKISANLILGALLHEAGKMTVNPQLIYESIDRNAEALEAIAPGEMDTQRRSALNGMALATWTLARNNHDFDLMEKANVQLDDALNGWDDEESLQRASLLVSAGGVKNELGAMRADVSILWQAVGLLETAVEILQNLRGNDRCYCLALGNAYTNLSFSYNEIALHENKETNLRKALEYSELAGEEFARRGLESQLAGQLANNASFRIDLYNLTESRRDLQAALTDGDEALRLSQELGLTRTKAQALLNRAVILRRLAQLDTNPRLLDEAFDHLNQIGRESLLAPHDEISGRAILVRAQLYEATADITGEADPKIDAANWYAFAASHRWSFSNWARWASHLQKASELALAHGEETDQLGSLEMVLGITEVLDQSYCPVADGPGCLDPSYADALLRAARAKELLIVGSREDRSIERAIGWVTKAIEIYQANHLANRVKDAEALLERLQGLWGEINLHAESDEPIAVSA